MNSANVIGPRASIAARIASIGVAASPTIAVWRGSPAGRIDAVDGPAIREAASAICVRDGRSGEPEVLVVQRSEESRFLPGYVAFPGGAVEPGDDSRAARWFGSADEGRRAAALRALIVEVGPAVTAGGVVPGRGRAPVDGFSPRSAAARRP